MSDKVKIGVLISGRGSNMMSIAAQINEGGINGEIVLVLSNRAGAPGLEKADRMGLETLYIDHRDYESREDFDKAVVDELKNRGAELICLAGFMRLLSPYFVQRYPNRIMNIHPAILPSFPGLDGQKQAFDYGVKVSGCTVHFVDEKLDHGPIILQKVCPIEEDDTLESFSERLLKLEHEAYPKAVRLYCDRKIEIEGRKVNILK